MSNKILRFIVSTVFIVVSNAVFFISFGLNNPKDIWLCYCFTMIAYFCVLFTSLFTKKGRSNYILGLSLYAISFYYFFLQMALCGFYFSHRELGYKFLLIVQIILLGLYAFVFLSNVIANNKTSEQIEKQEKEISFIKTNAAKIKALQEETDDKEISKSLERLYDLLHSSQSKSSSSVEEIERNIQQQIDRLDIGKKSELADHIKSVERLVKERNSILQRDRG